MSSWSSYPSIFNLGHKAVEELLLYYVQVEEKIDGSQFSFGIIDGVLRCRSKGVELNVDAPEKMFSTAVTTVKQLAPQLTPEWTYRGEVLSKLKHNTLTYSRVPTGNIIIFDINMGEQDYAHYSVKAIAAHKLGLEVVPLLWAGPGSELTFEKLKGLLEFDSCLGGTRIEGVVIKPLLHNIFGVDKKLLMAKYVSEVFKEAHKKDWHISNPTGGDILQQLSDTLCTEARWQKAVQHLAETGHIENSPRDIGALIVEVQQDILREERQYITEELFKWAWKQRLQRAVIAGLPEWYKEKLAKEALDCQTK